MSLGRCRIKRNAPFYLAAVLIALALKHHYSLSGPGDLKWILGPTAGLVSILSGEQFAFHANAGYVQEAGRVAIAPACAGVNFMLMAFGMASFTGLHVMDNHRHRCVWLLSSLAASYGMTIGVNTLRIMVSIHTLQTTTFASDMAWEQAHRLEGIVIYFFFQYLFYSMIRKIIEGYAPAATDQKTEPSPGHPGRRRFELRNIALTGMTPCAWYLGVTLVVPFLNGASRNTDGRFYDHAVMVLGICLATWMCIAFTKLCGQGVRQLFTGGNRKHEAQNPDCRR
jgi:exosortase K